MRKLLLVALLVSSVGCSSLGGIFGDRKREPIAARTPDPLLSPDIDEQQRYGRSRYAYPDSDRNVGPPVFQDRPSPSGR